MTAGRKLAASVFVLGLILTACGGGPALSAESGADDATTSNLSRAGEASSTRGVGLTGAPVDGTQIEMTDVVAYVFPISSEDRANGARLVDDPWVGDYIDALGACMTARGFEEIGTEIVRQGSVSYAPPAESWLYPDLEYLSHPAAPTADDVALAQTWSPLSLIDAPSPEFAADALRDLPEAGVPPESAAQLLAVGVECRSEARRAIPDSLPPDLMREATEDWAETMHAIDASPEVDAAIDGATSCLRGVDPVFESATARDWWGWYDGAAATLRSDSASVEAALQTEWSWQAGFAECIGPVVDARDSHRRDAREEATKKYSGLLEELLVYLTS